MPTNKPRVTFTIDEKQLEKIDKYRFEYKLKNQTQAILSLIENGLDAIAPKDSSNKPDFSKEELEHIKKYRNLDDCGKEVVDFVLNKEYDRFHNSEYIEVAARGGKYKVKREDILDMAERMNSEPYEKDDDLC